MVMDSADAEPALAARFARWVLLGVGKRLWSFHGWPVGRRVSMAAVVFVR